MTENNLNNQTQENKYSNLFVEESDDNTEHYDLNNLFTSYESSDSIKKNKVKIPKNLNVDNNLNQINTLNELPKSYLGSTTTEKVVEQVKNATTGMDVFDNDAPEFIDENEENIETISECPNSETGTNISPPNSPVGPKNKKSKKEGISGIVENMLKRDDKNINGWDSDANVTITNWYNTFKQQSFIYQFVLDKNRKMADRLAITSIISSALLGIFSGFKLWIDNDVIFQTVSNILLMLLNFLVALITASSKKYIDDKRNETIRAYVEEVDIFIGELSAQVLNSPVYRMNADRFFKLNNTKYTKLISFAPNLSISEINEGKKKFSIYKEHCHYNV
jgi:multisubunit Na+/H+ antiporter MnhF subunit